jgi:hypothetical protein
MKVLPVTSGPFSRLFKTETLVQSEGSNYLDFSLGGYKYNYIRPYSDFVIRDKKLIEGRELLLMSEGGCDDKNFFVDLEFNKIDVHGLKYSNLFSSDAVGDYFIFHNYDPEFIEPTTLKVFERFDRESIKEVCFSYRKFIPYGSSIIAILDYPTRVYKLDRKLNIKWQREFSHDHIQGRIESELLEYKDSVIINLGITDRDKKLDGEIFALLKETGETKWSFKYDAPIHSCQLIQGRIYLTSFNQWIILDANSGEVILEGESGFELENDEAVGANLWSDGEFLFFSSVWGSKIRIYHESTGKFHGDINCPEGFSISARPPVSLNGYHYFDLSSDPDLIACYHGVLITSTEEVRKGAPFNIKIEKNENFTIEAVDQGNGQAYDIHFNESVLGHILRFGRIEAQKIAFSNTYNMLASLSDDYGKHINKLFNGQIIFKIKQSVLEQPLEEKLDLMCNLIETHCEKYTAPHAKEKVKVSWQWS